MSASAEAMSARPAERSPAWEHLLYDSQGRPCGRPPAAAVLGRQAPTATAEPASPSAPGQRWPTPWMPIAHAAVRRSEQTGHSQHRRSSAPTRLLTNLVERRRLARRANDGLRATSGGRARQRAGLSGW
jgi:hypothetical protein